MHSDTDVRVDDRSMTVLVLLNVSAVFDVLDRSVLIRSLEFPFGLKDEALSWVK